MLDATEYKLPKAPSADGNEDPKVVIAEMRMWQHQVEGEWNRIVRDAMRESETHFSEHKFNAIVRGVVLIIVVIAIISTPFLAIFHGVPLDAFNEFIAPVTGIGGIIIGYWFGQDKKSESTSPKP